MVLPTFSCYLQKTFVLLLNFVRIFSSQHIRGRVTVYLWQTDLYSFDFLSSLHFLVSGLPIKRGKCRGDALEEKRALRTDFRDSHWNVEMLNTSLVATVVLQHVSPQSRI